LIYSIKKMKISGVRDISSSLWLPSNILIFLTFVKMPWLFHTIGTLLVIVATVTINFFMIAWSGVINPANFDLLTSPRITEAYNSALSIFGNAKLRGG
jgi:hypothetical protein